MTPPGIPFLSRRRDRKGDEPKPLGLVEKVGHREILGHLSCPPITEPTTVRLQINDLEVDRVLVPGVPAGHQAHFRFAVKDMWKYCGPQDRVTVRVGDACLPMPDGTAFYSSTAQGPEPLSALSDRLRAGELVDSWGTLVRPRYENVAWQQSATALYQQVSDAIREIAGLDTFLIYGSLLGAVREGRPLGHDLDFDAAYISSRTDPSEAAAQAGRIAQALQDRGFSVEARVTCLHVSNAERTQRIDIFHLYFNEEDELRFPWGTVGEKPFTKDRWQGLERITFAGAQVLVPRNAEEFVETLYGPNWRIPNPGFDWTRERASRADEAYLPAQLRPIINWDDYWAHAELDAPSQFARVVLALDLEPSTVIDMGCGDGRDAPRFIRSGHRVLGLDRSTYAIRSAQRRHLARDRATFVACDLEEADGLTASVADWDGAPQPLLFYARQLLDCIPTSAHDDLFDSISKLARPGDVVALEFRGLADDTLTAHHKWSCGRHQVDPEPVRRNLTQAGFTIAVDEEGARWEKRGSKGVYLHRIVGYKE